MSVAFTGASPGATRSLSQRTPLHLAGRPQPIWDSRKEKPAGLPKPSDFPHRVVL